MKDLKYEHQSIIVGMWWGGWRGHGVGAYTHPSMKSTMSKYLTL